MKLEKGVKLATLHKNMVERLKTFDHNCGFGQLVEADQLVVATRVSNIAETV